MSFTSEVAGEGTYSGVMSGTGKLVVSSFNTQVVNLTGNNTYSGGTAVSGGASLASRPPATSGQARSPWWTNGALRWASGSTVDIPPGSPRWRAAGRLMVNGNNVTLASTISGSGALFMQGSGILTLAGANTYSGGTNITSFATVVVSSDANLGAAAGGLFIVDSTLRTTASFSSARTVLLGEMILQWLQHRGNGCRHDLDADRSHQLFPQWRRSEKGRRRHLLLTGDNDFDGGVIVAAGTLKLGHAASIVSLSLEGGTTVDLNGYTASVVAFQSFGGTVKAARSSSARGGRFPGRHGGLAVQAL